ncbi:MAG: Stp1/IreP family PP2C-type Ser/Thr phosphatase [Clostridia bacterium]|nr:Stp1/IreP family PP2C-type Ser/Thr phosphatase [Clostridia bacterium]
MRIGASTDLGKTRPINEDNYYVSEYVSRPGVIYAMVADGMGGHNAGETASEAAVNGVSDYINRYYTTEVPQEQIKDMLIGAINSVNKAIYTEAQDNAKFYGMGTTLTACFYYAGRVTVAHVGDSRAYVLRDDLMHKITSDHSLVAELLANGQITPEQARNHPQKNVITRAVGTDPHIEIDIYEFDVQEGDIILLCTDGLSNMLSDKEMQTLISENKKMEDAAEKLVSAANDKGGFDNITAVLLQI